MLDVNAPQFVDTFHRLLRDDQALLPALLSARDIPGVCCWVHRQAGALAIMGHDDLARQAQQLCSALFCAADERAIQAVRLFGQALATLL